MEICTAKYLIPCLQHGVYSLFNQGRKRISNFNEHAASHSYIQDWKKCNNGGAESLLLPYKSQNLHADLSKSKI